MITNKDTGTKYMPAAGTWILATRPKTLPAAVSPVVVGAAMAVADQEFKWLPALAALITSLLLQIGVNLANDYFDYKKGVDTADRLGPVRVTQSGLISPGRVKTAMCVTFGLAASVGVYLIMVGGWPILMLGCASILAALAYSGGPYPLGSHGFGDPLVFLFFGLAAVCGTYYVQALKLTWLVVLTAAPVGFLITAILVVNNLRDINTDRAVSKRTLAVILEDRKTRIEYTLLLGAAYVMPLLIWVGYHASILILLPVFSLPLALPTGHTIWKGEGAVLNQALAGTARLAFAYSVLFSLGIVVSLQHSPFFLPFSL
jgi:1,4-dihydroxy-2-naphthoate octaprenyltransferase